MLTVNAIFDYIVCRFQEIPSNVLVMLLLTLFLGFLLIQLPFRLREKIRWTTGLMLVIYLVVLFLSTLVFRKVRPVIGYDFHPFWSYSREDLLIEIVMNIFAFLPVGILLGCAFRSMKWWKVVMIGGCVSVLIETIQFYFKRGFAEVDDVMHNALGSLIGYVIYSMVRMGYVRIRKRRVEVG